MIGRVSPQSLTFLALASRMVIPRSTDSGIRQVLEEGQSFRLPSFVRL